MKLAQLVSFIILMELSGCGVQSLKCFVCNNGNAVRPNVNCPADGLVIQHSVPLRPCSGKCFIRTGHWQTGAILHRGCISKNHNQGHLSNGCDVIGGEIWCLCDKIDGCNGRRLGE